MKELIAFICGAVMIGTLAACVGNDKPNDTATTPSGGALTPSVYSEADFDTSGDIVIETEHEIYGSDAPEVSYTIKNNTSEEFVYGVEYAVEVYQDGIWYHVAFPEDTAWIAIGIVLKPNGTNADSFSFSHLDYAMTDGRYRLIKEIGGKRYFAEFQVGASPITAETPFGYQALEKLPKEYTSEEAVKNGDVVITYTETLNAEKLDAFVNKVSLGIPAMIRIVQYTIEGDPSILDFIFSNDHRSNYLIRYDGSRDQFGANANITETIYSYLITDGSALYFSNCASWELTTIYNYTDYVQVPGVSSRSESAGLIELVETMTVERVKWNITQYKVYAPGGDRSVALTGGLAYSYEDRTSGETRQVSDPDEIATKITDVVWLNDSTFVLVCNTTSSLKYYEVVGSAESKSGYGTSYKVTDGQLIIM